LGQITSVCSQASLQLIEVSSVCRSSRPGTQHFHQCICDYLSLLPQCSNTTHIKLWRAISQHRLSDYTLANVALTEPVRTPQVSQMQAAS